LGSPLQAEKEKTILGLANKIKIKTPKPPPHSLETKKSNGKLEAKKIL